LGVVIPPEAPRAFTLKESDIAKIISTFPTPSVVFTGVVSVFQHQIASALKTLGVKVVGYDDSFSFWNQNTFQKIFLETVDELLVTAQFIADRIKQQFNTTLPIHAVGNPTTIEWQNAPKQIDHNTVRYGLVGNDPRPNFTVYWRVWG